MKLVNRTEMKMFGNVVAFVEIHASKATRTIISMEYTGENAFKPVVVTADNDKDADALYRRAIADIMINHHVNDIKMNVKAWGETEE